MSMVDGLRRISAEGYTFAGDAADEIDRLSAENQELKAATLRMAKWMRQAGNRLRDQQACLRCMPTDKIIIPGFVCTYHEAMDLLPHRSVLKTNGQEKA